MKEFETTRVYQDSRNSSRPFCEVGVRSDLSEADNIIWVRGKDGSSSAGAYLTVDQAKEFGAKLAEAIEFAEKMNEDTQS